MISAHPKIISDHMAFWIKDHQRHYFVPLKMAGKILAVHPPNPLGSRLIHQPLPAANASDTQLRLHCRRGIEVFSHRIHGAAIYGVPWIPSIYPQSMLAYIPAPWILWVWGELWVSVSVVGCQLGISRECKKVISGDSGNVSGYHLVILGWGI